MVRIIQCIFVIANTIFTTKLNSSYRYDFALFGFFSDVIAENFFAPSVAAEMEMQDDLGFSSEIVAEGDTENLIKSFLVYGIGELELCYVHRFFTSYTKPNVAC